MTGTAVKDARRARGWSQSTLARRLGVTQAYVSLLESDARGVPDALAARLVRLLGLPPTELPHRRPDGALDAAASLGSLAALGCPHVAHLPRGASLNPAEVVVRTLRTTPLEARSLETLPWLLRRYPRLDWAWLMSQARQHDLQNRLGFVVALASELAANDNDAETASLLDQQAAGLARAILREPDDLGLPLTRAERVWLTEHRPPLASRWNVLSNLTAEDLPRA